MISWKLSLTKAKWKWAGHVARMNDDSLNSKMSRVASQTREEVQRKTAKNMAHWHPTIARSNMVQKSERLTAVEGSGCFVIYYAYFLTVNKCTIIILKKKKTTLCTKLTEQLTQCGRVLKMWASALLYCWLRNSNQRFNWFISHQHFVSFVWLVS